MQLNEAAQTRKPRILFTLFPPVFWDPWCVKKSFMPGDREKHFDFGGERNILETWTPFAFVAQSQRTPLSVPEVGMKRGATVNFLYSMVRTIR
jgi:hypothetical protein